MFKLTTNILTLSFSKENEDVMKLVHQQLSSEFPTYGLRLTELKDDPNIIVSHLIFKGAVVYCGINKIQTLCDGTQVCNFSFAYLHPFFRTLGLGKSLFKQRIEYCEKQYPNLNFTTTIRQSNEPSLKIVKSFGFISICDYNYRNGEKGVKMIKINN